MEDAQTEFSVMLTTVGENRSAAVKAIRAATGVGLNEATSLVNSTPVMLIENVSETQAYACKKIVEESGSQIEIK